MLTLSLIGILLVAATVLIHAVGTTYWVAHLSRRYTDGAGDWRPRSVFAVLIATGVILMLLHVVEVAIWAVAYQVTLPAGELATFEEALYFSLVTYTSLGYGDITLGQQWRLLSGIEALNGMLLVGWTTALLFAVVQRSWRAMAQPRSPQQ